MRAKLNPETRKQKGWREARPSFSVSTPRERSFRGHHSFGHVARDVVVVPCPRWAFAGGLAARRASRVRALRRRRCHRGLHGDPEAQDPQALRAHRPRPASFPAESVRSPPLRLSLVILRAQRAAVPDRQSLVHVLRASTGTPRWTTTAGNTARRSPRRSRPWSRPRAGTSPTSLPADPSRTRAS